MKKIFLLVLLLQVLSLVSFSQNESPLLKKSEEKVIIDGKKYYLHKVEAGQTIYAISHAYNIDEKELLIHNPSLSQGLKTGQIIKVPFIGIVLDKIQPIVDTANFYMVKIRRKHTLYSLSKQYNVTIPEIYEANSGLENRSLRRNETILIPRHEIVPEKIDFTDPVLQRDSDKYVYHKVKSGETLYSISRKYKITKDVITDNNPELLNRQLRRGETIKVPKNDVQFVVTFPVKLDPTQKEDTVSYPFMQFDTLEVIATDSLDVLLLLPFNAESSLKQTWLLEKNDKDPQIYSVSEKMVQFYEGVLLSIEDIDMYGKHISLNVQDTKMNTSETSRILSELKSVPDVIIGPVHKDNIKLCLEYGMKHNVNVVTSVLQNSDDLFKYPNLISVSSNLRINNDFVASYLINRDDNIVIVHDGSEKYSAIATQMKNDLQEYFETQNVVGENEVKIFYFDKENQKSLKSFISEQDTNFVVSLSNKKIFVTSLMDALYQCNKSEIRLLGDQSYLSFDNVEIEEFQALSFSYVSTVFINYSDTLSSDFTNRFREAFLDEPGRYAFMGYDMTSLVIPELFKYGRNISNEFLNKEKMQGLSMSWKFMRNHSSQPILNTSLNLVGIDKFYKLSIIY